MIIHLIQILQPTESTSIEFKVWTPKRVLLRGTYRAGWYVQSSPEIEPREWRDIHNQDFTENGLGSYFDIYSGEGEVFRLHNKNGLKGSTAYTVELNNVSDYE